MSSRQRNIGSCKPRIHAYAWRGLSRVYCNIELGQSLTESSFSWLKLFDGEKRTISSFLRFPLIWWLSVQVNFYHWNRTGSLYNCLCYCFFFCQIPVICSSVSLRSLSLMVMYICQCYLLTDTYEPPCVKQVASGKLPRSTGSSALCFVNT